MSPLSSQQAYKFAFGFPQTKSPTPSQHPPPAFIHSFPPFTAGVWESLRPPSETDDSLEGLRAVTLLVTVCYIEKIQIESSKEKATVQSPGDSRSQLPAVSSFQLFRASSCFSPCSPRDSASLSQQGRVTHIQNTVRRGSSPEPWSPGFVLEFSHTGILHPRVTLISQPPSEVKLIQHGLGP